MQIKIVMIGILVACSYLIGEYIYKAYVKRHKQISELIRILEVMRMDLSFGLYTLEEIFFRVGENKEFTTSKFFKDMSEDLKNENNITLEKMLENNFVIWKKKRIFKKKS